MGGGLVAYIHTPHPTHNLSRHSAVLETRHDSTETVTTRKSRRRRKSRERKKEGERERERDAVSRCLQVRLDTERRREKKKTIAYKT